MIDKKFKILVHKLCVKRIEEKLNTLKKAISDAQQAANNETKSSAGDKHETGRAMAQLETEKLGIQAEETIKQLELVNRINPFELNEKVALGSLVETSQGLFYLSISLGKIEIDKQMVYAISTQSPIAKQLIGLNKNSKINFNGKEIKVQSIY